jgi:3-dehydroquinate synthase
MKEITVNTAHSAYPIRIGSGILAADPALDRIIEGRRSAFIVSGKVYDLHGEHIRNVISRYPRAALFIMDDLEENKSYSCAERFLQGFVDKGLTRESAVVGIGGGVVGDFAGYCASLYMRGIPVIHIPTTLLAMVDSSIGGKVAVNLNVGKNIVGQFYQPSLVLSDTSFLATLPERELKCGLAEILKHGLIGDRGTLEILERHTIASIREEAVMSELIYLSARFKASVVEQDEREGGLRAILNFGHTVGHAIESFMQYRGVSHGEAVAMGMLAEARLSEGAGLLSGEGLRYAEDMLSRYGLLELKVPSGADELIEHMKYDKKNTEDSIRFILLESPGRAVYGRTLDEGILRSVMAEIFG